MRYIIFSRVSTNMQTTENQLFECRRLVDSIKLDGDEVIEFDEETKTTRIEMEERPIFQDMLKFLRRGDTLVFYKLTRLVRGHELSMLYHRLKQRGIILLSVIDKEITDILIHAYALVGAAERENIRTQTTSGLKRKIHSMEKVGTAWFGYKTDERFLQPREKVRSTGKPYLLIEDPTEQMAIALMKKLHSEGYSYQSIANEVNEAGYRNRNGNEFHKKTIWRILQREESLNPSHLLEQAEKSRKCI